MMRSRSLSGNGRKRRDEEAGDGHDDCQKKARSDEVIVDARDDDERPCSGRVLDALTTIASATEKERPAVFFKGTFGD